MGRNPIAERMNQLPFEYKIEDSIFEIDSIQKEFMRRLMGDENTKPKSFEQLHSEIKENHKGEEREKRIAALKTAFDIIDAELQQKNQIRFETENQFNARFSIFSDGVSSLLETFEQMHSDIKKNFVGKERALRIEALEYVFLTASSHIATSVAFLSLNMAAYVNKIGGITTDQWQSTTNEIQDHVNSQLQSALDFFNATGRFSGFADTEAANLPGALSFNDIATIMRGDFNINFDSDLSESGRDFLYNILDNDVPRERLTPEQLHQRFLEPFVMQQSTSDPSFILQPTSDLGIELHKHIPHIPCPIMGTHYLCTTWNAAESLFGGKMLSLGFGVMLFRAFDSNGIEGSMELFERIRGDLKANFEGAELEARLRALEMGFRQTGEWIAQLTANDMLRASPNYVFETEDIVLCPRQRDTNSRIENEAHNLMAHINNMFRAALSFFNATGSFAGFFDTAEANVPGMLSMRDVDTLFSQDFNQGFNTASTEVINTSGLSDFGRAYLQRFLQIT
ncbi:MAG: hypothetical protein FWF81_12620 [Defluviitaleaceae bacterium]|nr:hypothetical protein [Defluviitaleaceae bacterium]